LIQHINNRLNDWARFVLQRADGGSVVSSTYLMMRRGDDADDAPPPACTVPINDLECSVTDRCVNALDAVLHQAVREFYLRTGTTIAGKAQHCRCSEKTLYRRIDEAHRQIMGYLNDLSAGVPLPMVVRERLKKVA
jgi:hypothetical protein